MTLPNFSQYQPPGVYWQQTAPQTTQTSTGLPNGVAIVGPSIGYRVFSESVVVNATGSANSLTQKGIVLSSVVATSTSGTNYTVGLGFETPDTDILVEYADGGTTYSSTAVTKIAVGETGNVPVGTTINVTYHYIDDTFYNPTMVNDPIQASDLYGAAADQNGNIISPLTQAATLAFQNGARNVYLVAVPMTGGAVTTADLQAGIDKLSAVESVGLVVPLPVGLTSQANIQTALSNFKTYLEDVLATGNLFQMGIFGYEAGALIGAPGYDASNISAQISQYVSTSRMISVFPNDLTMQTNAISGGTTTVGGFYLAAALAGVLATNPVQQGLTRQNVVGFTGIDPIVFNRMKNAYKNTLSANGMCVVELTRSGNLQVRHGLTTDTTSVYTREISLVRIQDDMIDTILQTLNNNNIIGSPIHSDTASTIAGTVNVILAGLELQGAIVRFSGITVTQSQNNPTLMAVTFKYVPAYPLNYITVTFGIDTSSGALVGNFPTNSAGTAG